MQREVVKERHVRLTDRSESGLEVAAHVTANETGERCDLAMNGETLSFARWETLDVLVRVAAAARDEMKSEADARKLRAAASR